MIRVFIMMTNVTFDQCGWTFLTRSLRKSDKNFIFISSMLSRSWHILVFAVTYVNFVVLRWWWKLQLLEFNLFSISSVKLENFSFKLEISCFTYFLFSCEIVETTLKTFSEMLFKFCSISGTLQIVVKLNLKWAVHCATVHGKGAVHFLLTKGEEGQSEVTFQHLEDVGDIVVHFFIVCISCRVQEKLERGVSSSQF